MRNIMVVGLFTLLLPAVIAAKGSSEPDAQRLEEYSQKVTGDSTEELIELKGKRLAQDSDYYAKIWATISRDERKEWKIPYEGGYDPGIHFYDLNHDGVNDIFYQSTNGGSNGSNHYHLHTLKNDRLNEIALPKQKSIKADFKNNFKVEIQIDYEQEPSIVDVKDRSSEYVELGIYNENGKLTESTSPVIAPIGSFKPVKISDDKGYGLRSRQHISGAYQADRLGTVKTLWYYEEDKWVILKTKWIPSK
ncbi:hypothetical protein GCM10007063_22380 [Lentibacillus kapialis]|uniref:VCBS repeat-containing protein n=1 Tax=Lentibacillus kapialis TaxID=340214 RepID=A0A917UZ67_9BACI|nr:hypothetical protein [Lentibacillus kapialis]GGJ99576.1 hypothetical protein GCM10007063_22380 [Lentibacillus kapialis]